MSWLGRSVANSLLLDDHPQPVETGGAGVKEDLSEFAQSLTRQLRGVASFLAPLPSQPDPYVPAQDHHHHHVSNSAYDGSEEEAVAVTEEALAFARNISHHPETWLDFPLSQQEDHHDFEMSDTQWNHVTLVERLAPGLAALRIELCPIHMSESYFWKVYFVLLHPRLNKHDADLVSTPQIVAARTMWMKELQEQTKSEEESWEKNTCSNLLYEDQSTTSSDFTSANMSDRTTVPDEYPFVTQEEGLSKAPLEHDDDDWVHENTELDGYDGPDVVIGTDEEISFSDLEADDD